MPSISEKETVSIYWGLHIHL